MPASSGRQLHELSVEQSVSMMYARQPIGYVDGGAIAAGKIFGSPGQPPCETPASHAMTGLKGQATPPSGFGGGPWSSAVEHAALETAQASAKARARIVHLTRSCEASPVPFRRARQLGRKRAA
jgi:hypothetical protein